MEKDMKNVEEKTVGDLLEEVAQATRSAAQAAKSVVEAAELKRISSDVDEFDIWLAGQLVQIGEKAAAKKSDIAGANIFKQAQAIQKYHAKALDVSDLGFLPRGTANALTAAIGENAEVVKYVNRLKGTEETGRYPISSSTNAYWVADGAAPSAGDPTLTYVNYTVRTVANGIEISKAALNDFEIFKQFLLNNMLVTIAQKIDTGILVGDTASDEIQGIYHAVGSDAVDGSTWTNVIDELLALYMGIDGNFRNSKNFAFVMAPSTLAKLWQLKDGNNRYYFGAVPDGGAAAGFNATLFGHPILTNTALASYDSHTDIIIFGDFKQYALIDKLTGGNVDAGVKLTDEGLELVSKRSIYVQAWTRLAGVAAYSSSPAVKPFKVVIDTNL